MSAAGIDPEYQRIWNALPWWYRAWSRIYYALIWPLTKRGRDVRRWRKAIERMGDK